MVPSEANRNSEISPTWYCGRISGCTRGMGNLFHQKIYSVKQFVAVAYLKMLRYAIGSKVVHFKNVRTNESAYFVLKKRIHSNMEVLLREGVDFEQITDLMAPEKDAPEIEIERRAVRALEVMMELVAENAWMRMLFAKNTGGMEVLKEIPGDYLFKYFPNVPDNYLGVAKDVIYEDLRDGDERVFNMSGLDLLGTSMGNVNRNLKSDRVYKTVIFMDNCEENFRIRLNTTQNPFGHDVLAIGMHNVYSTFCINALEAVINKKVERILFFIGSREKPDSLAWRGKHILENVLMNIGNFILESDVGNVHMGNLPLVSLNYYSVIGFRHIISIF